MPSEPEFVPIGRINGLYGVRGWLKVFSHTQPRDNILNYSPWLIQDKEWVLAEGKAHGKGIVVKLSGIDDRDAAACLIGSDIYIRRNQLQPLAEDEYYWLDLIGMQVQTVEGIPLGKVASLFETGANDVMVVQGERERLLPWLPDSVIVTVDCQARSITVDWDPDF